MIKRSRATNRLLVILLLVAVLILRYQSLSDSQKRFLHNLLRQLPYLPARYMV